MKTTEDGGTATFTVKLKGKPTADVTIALYSLDQSEATVSHQSLTFTPQNWNSDQIVTVTGMDDDIIDGDMGYNVVLSPAVSTDTEYSGLDPADVSLINTDNDTGSVTGDIDGDGDIDLTDAILALQVLSGTNTNYVVIRSDTDVNKDKKIGLEEAVYILQVVAEIRN